MEVTNVFLTKHHEIDNTEKTPMIKICVGGRTAVHTNFNDIRTGGMWNSWRTVWYTWWEIKVQHKETILLLQYWTLVRQSDKLEEEWMGILRVRVTEWKYKEWDRRLKEQFINGIIYWPMTAKIIKELATIKDISEVMSEQVLSWTKIIEVQWSQKALLENL